MQRKKKNKIEYRYRKEYNLFVLQLLRTMDDTAHIRSDKAIPDGRTVLAEQIAKRLI